MWQSLCLRRLTELGAGVCCLTLYGSSCKPPGLCQSSVHACHWYLCEIVCSMFALLVTCIVRYTKIGAEHHSILPWYHKKILWDHYLDLISSLYMYVITDWMHLCNVWAQETICNYWSKSPVHVDGRVMEILSFKNCCKVCFKVVVTVQKLVSLLIIVSSLQLRQQPAAFQPYT